MFVDDATFIHEVPTPHQVAQIEPRMRRWSDDSIYSRWASQETNGPNMGHVYQATQYKKEDELHRKGC
jgi:hypothetical protein